RSRRRLVDRASAPRLDHLRATRHQLDSPSARLRGRWRAVWAPRAPKARPRMLAEARSFAWGSFRNQPSELARRSVTAPFPFRRVLPAEPLLRWVGVIRQHPQPCLLPVPGELHREPRRGRKRWRREVARRRDTRLGPARSLPPRKARERTPSLPRRAPPRRSRLHEDVRG